jgi:site-specific recombinase XerD
MIKAFFKFLVADGIIDDSPAKVIRAPRPHYGEREIKYLDKDEIRKITKIMETSRYTNKDRAMFHLLLSTGMRVNEMLSLTKKNSYINIEERKIFLAKTKTRRPHYIMFSKEAQYYLKLYLIGIRSITVSFYFMIKRESGY